MISIKEKMALDYLSKDKILYIDMIEAIRRKTAKIFYAEKDGVLLKEIKSDAHMMAVDNTNICKKVLKLVDNSSMFVVHQKPCMTIARDKFNLLDGYICYQAVYTSKEKLPVDDTYNIFNLTEDYVDEVHSIYHSVDDIEYVRNIIKNGNMFGIKIDGKLAGFIGVHEEGSMGMLEVIPEYRQRGIASTLEAYLINHMLDKGYTPFGQVFTDNENSLKLQKKMNMVISENPVFWIFN